MFEAEVIVVMMSRVAASPPLAINLGINKPDTTLQSKFFAILLKWCVFDRIRIRIKLVQFPRIRYVGTYYLETDAQLQLGAVHKNVIN